MFQLGHSTRIHRHKSHGHRLHILIVQWGQPWEQGASPARALMPLDHAMFMLEGAWQGPPSARAHS